MLCSLQKTTRKSARKKENTKVCRLLIFESAKKFPTEVLIAGQSVRFDISLIEHVLSILASLCRNLTGNQRSRLIQKFVEDDHIKVREQIAFKFLFLWMSA